MIYGLRLDMGDFARGDYHCDLVLDIDHIVAWEPGEDDRPYFRVAPATLTFHSMTDLRIDIDFGDSGLQASSGEIWIGHITRTPQLKEEQKICLDRPYYFWRIEIVAPSASEITFGASGFTQALRAEPVLQAEQKLPPADRA